MRWVEPTEARAYYVAANVRREDEQEVWQPPNGRP